MYVVRKTENVLSWSLLIRNLLNNQKGAFFVFLTTNIYYVHLISVGFEHSACHELSLTSLIILLP